MTSRQGDHKKTLERAIINVQALGDQIDSSPFNSLSAYQDRQRLVAIAPTYRIHTDLLSDVALENTRDIQCIFEQAVLLSLFCSGRFYIFLFY